MGKKEDTSIEPVHKKMSIRDKKNRVAVLGGGLCGLSAAQVLARAGVEVVVLEKESRVGGLARTIERHGCRVDIGSHRLHPDAFRGDLFSWLEDICGDYLKIRARRGRLRLYNRFIEYPPSLFGLLGALGYGRVVKCGVSFLKQKIYPTGFESPANFESRIIGKVGYGAYRIFYYPYALKVWRIDPKEISVDEVKKRVVTANPLVAFREVIKRFFAGKQDQDPVFMYPEGGIGTIAQKMEDDIKQNGGRIVTEATLQKIEVGEDHHLSKVIYTVEGKTESVPVEAIAGTISPHDLSVLISNNLPEKIEEALKHLSWRGMRLLYWQPPSMNYSDCETYYFPEIKYSFGRISVPSLFSPSMECPGGNRIICIELPSGENEDIWSMSDRDLLKILLPQLKEAGVVGNDIGEKSAGLLFSHYEKNVYPILLVDWREHYLTVYSWLRTFPNLFLLGRQGLFLHNNMDQSVAMGRGWARFYLSDDMDRAAWDEKFWSWSNWKIRD